MASAIFSTETIEVESSKVVYTEESITSEFTYEATSVTLEDGKVKARPVSEAYVFKTERRVPKLGVMIAGIGGNNGTTVVGSLLAHKHGIKWHSRKGEHSPDFLGSITQSSTVRLGSAAGRDVYVPMKNMLPMVEPTDLAVTGWDISGMNLGDAMKRASVFEYDLQRQLYPLMSELSPLPSIYAPDFIASNQGDRADNLLPGTPSEQMEAVRAQIRAFKASSGVDQVIVLWSANTERFADVLPGLNTTADELLASIKAGESEVSPSTLMAVASILEGCTYINGSPQNTFVPGVVELAGREGVFIGGDDFKSGQTKIKSVLVDFLVGAGIKPESIVSYNHLGNNDGKNLSAPKQFRSKEISKSNVVDDMIASNGIMYGPGEHPDHCVVIKYVPTVGDSKRAMDEYTSSIFMGGTNTISTYNVCEDSLLAAPLIIDLIILSELAGRVTMKKADEEGAEFATMHPVLSILSYLLKAPMVPAGTPVVNALFAQRAAICNLLRACVGLPSESHLLLEHRLTSAGVTALEGVPVDLSYASPAASGAGAAVSPELEKARVAASLAAVSVEVEETKSGAL